VHDCAAVSMGTIRQATTGRESVLLLEHVVGRSNRASLQLSGSYISAQHAVFRWANGRWQLKDLGSRNGTYIDGALISPGQSHRLTVGSRVTFGRPEETWELEDDSAPRPMVF
jgi:predicted component of type VI protein secretion system